MIEEEEVEELEEVEASQLTPQANS